ncbi:methyltransferase family protein [Bosea beijingensis]|uniref:methyltransferase family protein n=1 Tax=Bosea beijingensis TaxID=3068632 RepID=UPI002741ECC4|nr:isoprenylcysteine carboxylmethyltransferase family protein [Bosea sp. REN20]
MSPLEVASYGTAIGYVAGFLALTFALARSSEQPLWLFEKGSRRQFVPALLFRLSFAGAVLWPLATTIFAGAFSADPLSGLLSGKVPDLIGFALVLAGACLALFAQVYMGNSWRIGAAEDHVGRIVDGGPFAISRNPVFVGQALLFAGLFIAKPSLVQAGLTASTFYAIALQVRVEESVLLEALGEPYRAYCARVGRWIGYRPHQSGNT